MPIKFVFLIIGHEPTIPVQGLQVKTSARCTSISGPRVDQCGAIEMGCSTRADRSHPRPVVLRPSLFALRPSRPCSRPWSLVSVLALALALVMVVVVASWPAAAAHCAASPHPPHPQAPRWSKKIQATERKRHVLCAEAISFLIGDEEFYSQAFLAPNAKSVLQVRTRTRHTDLLQLTLPGSSRLVGGRATSRPSAPQHGARLSEPPLLENTC